MKYFFSIIIFSLFLISNVEAQVKDTVTTSSGIKYVSLSPGKGPKLQDGQKVKVYYTGKFINGKKFDTNKGDAPFQFKIGAGEVIPGWDEGFKLMSKGEKGILIVPSDLAYGKEGVKNPSNDLKYLIPPDSDLIFEVEVVK